MEPKYKVGQRVQRIHDSGGKPFVGAIASIISIELEDHEMPEPQSPDFTYQIEFENGDVEMDVFEDELNAIADE